MRLEIRVKIETSGVWASRLEQLMQIFSALQRIKISYSFAESTTLKEYPILPKIIRHPDRFCQILHVHVRNYAFSPYFRKFIPSIRVIVPFGKVFFRSLIPSLLPAKLLAPSFSCRHQFFRETSFQANRKKNKNRAPRSRVELEPGARRETWKASWKRARSASFVLEAKRDAIARSRSISRWKRKTIHASSSSSASPNLNQLVSLLPRFLQWRTILCLFSE